MESLERRAGEEKEGERKGSFVQLLEPPKKLVMLLSGAKWTVVPKWKMKAVPSFFPLK